jgi:lambda family phage tail tape measure protein
MTTKLLTQQQAAQDQLFGFQTDALKFADEMATTQAEHRKAQLDMLTIAYQQKAYDLQILAGKQKLAGDLAAAALTQAQINNLPVQQARAQALVVKNTMNPLEQWEQQFKPDQIIEDLQRIQVQGFDALASGITDVITGTKSLGAAFKDVAKSIISDIIQMTIRMLIFRAISGMFGGGGSTSITPLDGGAMSITTSAKGNAFSGGNVIPFALGGVVSSPTFFPMANGVGLMGEAGQEAVMPLARDSSGRLGVRAANNNQSGPIEIKIGFGDAPGFAPYVQDVAGAAAGQAVKISVDHTNRTLQNIARPKLMGR